MQINSVSERYSISYRTCTVFGISGRCLPGTSTRLDMNRLTGQASWWHRLGKSSAAHITSGSDGLFEDCSYAVSPSLPHSTPALTSASSWHFSLSLTYLPAWIVIAVIWKEFIFKQTSVAIILLLYILTGLSLASWTFLVAAPFASAPTLAAIVCT